MKLVTVPSPTLRPATKFALVLSVPPVWPHNLRHLPRQTDEREDDRQMQNCHKVNVRNSPVSIYTTATEKNVGGVWIIVFAILWGNIAVVVQRKSLTSLGGTTQGLSLEQPQWLHPTHYIKPPSHSEEGRKSLVGAGKNSSLAVPSPPPQRPHPSSSLLCESFPLFHSPRFLSTVAPLYFPIWLWLVFTVSLTLIFPLVLPSLPLSLSALFSSPPLLSSSPAARNFSVWSPTSASLFSHPTRSQTQLPNGDLPLAFLQNCNL